ncbi:MAG: hypothetical protein ACRDHP_14985, partial [Ktedonobacterales bacterium]
MSEETRADETARTCSRCGQLKPITDFDRRFLHKNCRLTCSACRGIEDESQKWRFSLEKRRAWERRREEEAREREWQIVEMRRNIQERENAEREHREQLIALGFTEREREMIGHIHYGLDTSEWSW